jgi:hypothetical protein
MVDCIHMPVCFHREADQFVRPDKESKVYYIWNNILLVLCCIDYGWNQHGKFLFDGTPLDHYCIWTKGNHWKYWNPCHYYFVNWNQLDWSSRGKQEQSQLLCFFYTLLKQKHEKRTNSGPVP